MIKKGQDVIEKEAVAIREMASRLDHNFEDAIKLILECKGRLIVTGMGKSGLVGKKVAATLSSTGIAAFFLHPAEGVHGDLGLVQSDDILIAISKSGATEELAQIFPTIRRLGVKTILLTGSINSPLANRCEIVLDCSVKTEACENNLVPTSSTTAAMVMGDALAIALLEERDFSPEDFAYLHPGGNLGRRLLMKVEEVMHVNSEIPLVSPDTGVRDMIVEITSKRLGAAIIIDGNNHMLGIFTDGDLRRLVQSDTDFFSMKASEVMIANPKSINPTAILDKALAFMEKFGISALPVVNDQNQAVGIIHLHDILKSKLV